MEWEQVLKLREAIPLRHPRGDPRNKARIGPVRRFTSALKQYEIECGKPWRAKWNGAQYVPAGG